MAKINGNEIKPNMVIEYNGSVWRAMKCNAVKPGKGGAFNQVEMRNLFNGSKANERFRANETVERVRLEHLRDATDAQAMRGDHAGAGEADGGARGPRGAQQRTSSLS
ncbi:MAG: hypothetical protein ACPHYE_06150, partial [Henriciella sp.]